MPDRPYRRTCRQFSDGLYNSYNADNPHGTAQYILHPCYAQEPANYIRPFLLIQKDLQGIFEYIDPDDQNKDTYSFRILELLTRTCIEVEANFKAILAENGYSKSKNMNMFDYNKVEASHLLSGYKIFVPYWHGANQMRTPFSSWSNGKRDSLSWYQVYNAAKHNRHKEFKKATFDHLIEAVCGLTALLSAQFHSHSFIPGPEYVTTDSPMDGFDVCIGDYFSVKKPDWPTQDQYSFSSNDWQTLLKATTDPFVNYPYPTF